MPTAFCARLLGVDLPVPGPSDASDLVDGEVDRAVGNVGRGLSRLVGGQGGLGDEELEEARDPSVKPRRVGAVPGPRQPTGPVPATALWLA